MDAWNSKANPSKSAPEKPRVTESSSIIARPIKMAPMVNIKGDRAAADGAYTSAHGEEEAAPA